MEHWNILWNMALVPYDRRLSRRWVGPAVSAVGSYAAGRVGRYIDQNVGSAIDAGVRGAGDAIRSGAKRFRDYMSSEPSAKRLKYKPAISSFRNNGMSYHRPSYRKRVSRKRRLYRGRIKKRSSQTAKSHGWLSRYEFRNSKSGSECVGCLQAVGNSDILYVVMGALYRKLYSVGGRYIQDENDFPTFNSNLFNIVFTYRATPNDAARSNFTIPVFPNGATHATCIVHLRDEFVQAIANTSEIFIFEDVQMSSNFGGSTAASNQSLYNTLSLKHCSVELGLINNLVIQNRTPGIQATDDLVTDVTANPLKYWQCSIPGNTLRLVNNHSQKTAETGLGSGGHVSNSNYPDSDCMEVKDVHKKSKVFYGNLPAGGIHKMRTTYNKTMSFNQLMVKMWNYLRKATNLTADSTRAEVFLGNSNYIQMRKLMPSGGTEPDIACGFSSTCHISALIKRGKGPILSTDRFLVT